MRKIRWIMAVWLLLQVTQGYSWGREGHETVGYIATQLLRHSRAEQAISKILHTDETLAAAATWLDCARSYESCHQRLSQEQKQFTTSNPQHYRYHFTDIPFQLGRYQRGAIGAADDDVVQILTQAITVLRGNSTATSNPHHFTTREALFLVAHLVGDIHQPLHVGSAYVEGRHFIVPMNTAQAAQTTTQGANLLLDGKHNLHGTWDVYVVRRAMRDHHLADSRELAAYLLTGHVVPSKGQGNVLDWPSQWADESIQLAAAQFELMRISGQVTAREGRLGWSIHTPRHYTKQATRQAEQQLLKAGYRLAAVLQAIWP